MNESNNKLATGPSWQPKRPWYEIIFNRRGIDLFIVTFLVALLIVVARQLEPSPIQEALLFFCGSVWGAFFERWLIILLDGSEAYKEAKRIKNEVDKLMIGNKALWETVRVSLEEGNFSEQTLKGILRVLRLHKIQFDEAIFDYARALEELGFSPKEFLEERANFFKDITDGIEELIRNLRSHPIDEEMNVDRQHLLMNGRSTISTPQQNMNASDMEKDDEDDEYNELLQVETP
ncbi:MAG: hypothetical protein IT327_13110 [Anaerolineae bacterium]|nr:hypothetical protein [Anaerolineae bacterium]